ncbi:hypothetical protein BTO09_07460 [Gilvibacter sp. SZ-19]|nr:hypothetical protein BTO09_07460 [Gilvibacter sp. SZ-19]
MAEGHKIESIQDLLPRMFFHVVKKQSRFDRKNLFLMKKVKKEGNWPKAMKLIRYKNPILIELWSF